MSDERPPIWVGHFTIKTSALDDSYEYMQKIGMRPIAKFDDVAVLELRGGTHLVLLREDEVEPAEVAVDLMVDDLDATHATFTEDGLQPTVIERGRIHDFFYIEAPCAQRIKVNSTHVGDAPV